MVTIGLSSNAYKGCSTSRQEEKKEGMSSPLTVYPEVSYITILSGQNSIK